MKSNSNKKSFKLHRIITAFLAAILVTAMLMACGSSDPNLGKYKLDNMGGITVDDFASMMSMSKEEAQNYLTIELKSGGKAVLHFQDDEGSEDNEAIWKVDGENLTISDSSGEAVNGTVKDGVMKIQMEGEEVVLKK